MCIGNNFSNMFCSLMIYLIINRCILKVFLTKILIFIPIYENILIYATSNRRHLIKETWNDRNDVENSNGMHRSDTMEEKLSLVNRFGVTINYSKPSQKEYFEIVFELARKAGIKMGEDELKLEANKWELSHGGISGRTAQQFINHLMGLQA